MINRLIALLAASAALLAAQDGDARRLRAERLENSLLAPCCWVEPVSRHQSEVAQQMRDEIASFVEQGKTDREIIDYYKQKYGLRILVEPEGAGWWWMQAVPFAALALGLGVVVYLLKKWVKPLPAS